LFAATVVLFGCVNRDKPALAPVKSVTDNYFGVDVIDPYRYMEDMDDTTFLAWMQQYADYTRRIIDEIPGRASLLEQMTEFNERKSEQMSWLTISESGRYFYTKITPQDEIGKLYYRDAYDSEEVLLYDPNEFSDEDGVQYVIYSLVPDYTGERVCISLAPNGSESSTMIVLDVKSGKVLSDRIYMAIGVTTWIEGGRAILYGRTNSNDVHDPSRFLNTKVYYHKIGDKQSNDIVIFSSADYPEVEMMPEERPIIYYDQDQNDYYLILNTVERYLRIFHAKMQAFEPDKHIHWKSIMQKEDQIQNFYTIGDELYLYTAKNAPNFKIIRTSLANPDIENAKVVVNENDDGMISGFSFTRNALYYKMMFNGVEEKLFQLKNGESTGSEIKLPARAGSLGLRTRGHNHDDIWITLAGWTMDGERYRFEAEDNSFVPEPLSSIADFPEYEDLIVEEIMLPSHDGIMVSLSIIYKKGTKLNGKAPLLITGYGAYGISRRPYFSPYSLMWTLKGGVYAMAHVRGGGELGDNWRLGGQKTTKPNTWKDFIACVEYLQENNYSSPRHKAAYGVSAGGILIGRAMTESPELFAAAMSFVGLMNPLRVEQSPNGPANAPEFGRVKDSVECMALMEMDPYLKIQDGVDYPATLVRGGFNDPRVIVWQPAKFTARLQAANGSKNPILFDVDYSSGHGIGDTKTKSFEDLADLFAFALWQTGHEEFQK
ncbi:MAG: prolyl oligopeptidase family serine peptidase, partial [Bacteroidales bacterium]|nr:prolyl oligopeptidase family serine peptidase [Bacteroidales bacterium]